MKRAVAKSNSASNDSTPFVSLLTLVIWIFCVAVGVVGFVVPYQRPNVPVAAPSPMQAELIKVELSETELPAEIVAQPAKVPQPTAMKPLEIPRAPPMIAVAEPSPEIEFALPVEVPARIVDARSAIASVEQKTASASAPTPVQTLTFGSGEGKQPAPEYPARARREGQEGVVLVRFSVGENGRVLSAEAATPSQWPLLNESAVRTVRERWRFAPGGMRLYEVAICFQMRNRNQRK